MTKLATTILDKLLIVGANSPGLSKVLSQVRLEAAHEGNLEVMEKSLPPIRGLFSIEDRQNMILKEIEQELISMQKNIRHDLKALHSLQQMAIEKGIVPYHVLRKLIKKYIPAIGQEVCWAFNKWRFPDDPVERRLIMAYEEHL